MRVQDEADAAKRAAMMDQVHALLVQNYGSYALTEHPPVWLDNMAKSGRDAAEGMKLMLSVVLNEHGQAVGFTSMEVLPVDNRRYVLSGYTCGAVSPGVDGGPLVPDAPAMYPAVLYAAKADAAASVSALQSKLAAHDVHLQGHFQEHKPRSPDHQPKVAVGFVLGQMPLGVCGLVDYQIPVYPADVQGADGKVDPTLLTAMQAEGTHAELFINDITPSQPAMPMTVLMQEFAEAYATAHSVFAPDLTDDPGYRRLYAFAATLPEVATYRDVYTQAAAGARSYLEALGVPLIAD